MSLPNFSAERSAAILYEDQRIPTVSVERRHFPGAWQERNNWPFPDEHRLTPSLALVSIVGVIAQTPPPPDTGHWVHQINPFLIQFPESWPLEGIRWYGLAYVAGFAFAWWLLWLYSKKERSPFTPEQRADLLTAVIIGTLVGGRLGYFLLGYSGEFWSNPLIFFQVQKGGMASHGGMVGILLAMLWFARKHKYPFWQVSDIVVTLGPPGVFFGRIANFINGELYGRPSDVPWAMHFLDLRYNYAVGQYEPFWTPPVHPSQLYQASMEGLLLALYLQARFWLSDPANRTFGQLSGEFLIGYGMLRIAGEVFRQPDSELILGISKGSFYSVLMVVAGIAIIALRRKASPKHAT